MRDEGSGVRTASLAEASAAVDCFDTGQAGLFEDRSEVGARLVDINLLGTGTSHLVGHLHAGRAGAGGTRGTGATLADKADGHVGGLILICKLNHGS